MHKNYCSIENKASPIFFLDHGAGLYVCVFFGKLWGGGWYRLKKKMKDGTRKVSGSTRVERDCGDRDILQLATAGTRFGLK
ncbi:hypothetical protein Tco_0841798 [Tanacetum coccineum]|uniref:Uncharacterized protein n=1 Tax=Tanacetum coccineum TaxID=301880 RepID=A0ABQ5B1Q4_9ASTR